MSFHQHQPSITNVCVHCLEPWPCPTRRTVAQVADWLLQQDETLDDGWAGIYARLILKKGQE